MICPGPKLPRSHAMSGGARFAGTADGWTVTGHPIYTNNVHARPHSSHHDMIFNIEHIGEADMADQQADQQADTAMAERFEAQAAMLRRAGPWQRGIPIRKQRSLSWVPPPTPHFVLVGPMATSCFSGAACNARCRARRQTTGPRRRRREPSSQARPAACLQHQRSQAHRRDGEAATWLRCASTLSCKMPLRTQSHNCR